MFRGRYVHTIDAKNRMSLPADFRNELTRRGERAPILTNGHECLDLYSFEDWIEYERRIAAIADVDPAAQAFARMRISGATECPIDRQGRILVPPSPARARAAGARGHGRRNRSAHRAVGPSPVRREFEQHPGPLPRDGGGGGGQAGQQGVLRRGARRLCLRARGWGVPGAPLRHSQEVNGGDNLVCAEPVLRGAPASLRPLRAA